MEGWRMRVDLIGLDLQHLLSLFHRLLHPACLSQRNPENHHPLRDTIRFFTFAEILKG
jgi:hypothetical protein